MEKTINYWFLKFRQSRLITLITLSIFVFFSGYNISAPGPYYDELLFVNAALGGKIDLFISYRLESLPIFLMPYIGALKAWLYYPIFEIFGVSASTIRWPVVLIGALTLWVNYRFVKIAFSPAAAVIFIVLASIEPSTLYHTRLDWGPTALMMLFRGLLLLSVMSWVKSGNPKFLYIAYVVAVFGVFDKLNFVWIVFAVSLSLLIFYPDRILAFVRDYRNNAIFLLALVGISSAIFMYYVKHHLPLDNEIGNFNLASRIHQVAIMLHGTVGGVGVYNFVVENGQDAMASAQLLALCFAATTALLVLIIARKTSVEWRSLGFIISFILITFFQMFITRQATGPHHAAILAPLWLIPIAVLLGQAFVYKNHLGVVLKSGAVLGIVGVVASSVFIDVSYLKGFRGHIDNPNWDPGSYDLVEIISENRERPIVCVDWGCGTIVYGLLNGDVNINDSWPIFKDGFTEANIKFYEQGFLQQNPLFVVRAAGKEAFPETRKNFFEIVSTQGWNMNDLAVIKGDDGSPLYEIYEVKLAQ